MQHRLYFTELVSTLIIAAFSSHTSNLSHPKDFLVQEIIALVSVFNVLAFEPVSCLEALV